jgi:hypothetical protein
LRISSQDTALVVPPVKSNLKLNETEIELIRKWINKARYLNRIGLSFPKASPIPEMKMQPGLKTKLIILFSPGSKVWTGTKPTSR